MDLNDAEIDRLFDEAKAGGGDISRKKKLLEKQKKGNVGGSENSVAQCFPDYTDGGPSGDQRSIWQCEHPAGGVYCGAADGGGVGLN
jgi:hypothetical protein